MSMLELPSVSFPEWTKVLKGVEKVPKILHDLDYFEIPGILVDAFVVLKIEHEAIYSPTKCFTNFDHQNNKNDSIINLLLI